MIEQLLKEHSGQLLAALTAGGGLEPTEAKELLPPAIDGIGDAVKSSDLNIADLLGGGGAAALLSKLDIGSIASSAGLEEGKARSGLSSLIPVVISLLGDKAGGAGELLASLGGEGGGKAGALGALGGIAGKLFGK